MLKIFCGSCNNIKSEEKKKKHFRSLLRPLIYFSLELNNYNLLKILLNTVNLFNEIILKYINNKCRLKIIIVKIIIF